MKLLIKTAVTLLGLLAAVLSFSQTTDNLCKQKMKQLDFMIGKWTGGGWMINQDRTRSEFLQEEVIESDLNGTVLVIHGKGWDQDQKPIHHAFGIISYNLEEEKYNMLAFLEDGKQTKANLEIIEDGKIKWWFEAGNGTIKYTITYTNNAWNEKGEFSPNGEVWFPFIEFNLNRQ